MCSSHTPLPTPYTRDYLRNAHASFLSRRQYSNTVSPRISFLSGDAPLLAKNCRRSELSSLTAI